MGSGNPPKGLGFVLRLNQLLIRIVESARQVQDEVSKDHETNI